jgi:hypothetical protein
MFDIGSTVGLRRCGSAGVLLFLAATATGGTEPAPLPTTQPVAVDVDISGLPASEQAALVPIIRAARQLDALYVRQVWPGTRALMRERQAAQTSAAEAELVALNFFQGSVGTDWGRFHRWGTARAADRQLLPLRDH